MKRRILKRTLFLLGILGLVAGTVLLYLFNTDLTWSRDPLARAVSRTLGRQITINGEYHLRLGTVSHLEAHDIVLANAPWASEGPLASIGRLELEVETRSLLWGPIHVRSLRLDRVELRLESDARGRGNWASGKPKTGGAGKARSRLPLLDHAEVHGFHMGYETPSRAKPLDLMLPEARFHREASNLVQFDLQGAVDGKPLRLAGHLGPLGRLLGNEPFDQDLSFRLGTLEGQLKGRTASLSTLAGASLDLTLHGPELAELTALLGLPEERLGAFRLEATTRPAGAAIDARLEAMTSLIQAKASGRIVPGRPPALNLTITASGGDLGALAALGGVQGLPAEPFTLQAGLQAHGFPIGFKELTIQVGKSSVAARGTLGRPPAFDGTDASVELHAPDASLIGRLAHTKLPTGKLAARGRITVEGDKVRISGLDARIGRNELRADGTVGLGARKAGAAFEIEARGPELAVFDPLAGTSLPPGPFQATGRISTTSQGIRLETIRIELGGNWIEASGTVTGAGNRAGSEVKLSLGGRDPAFLASLAGIRGLPAEPYRARGRLHVGARSLEIREVELRVGEHDAKCEIRLARPPAAGPVELRLQAQGKDLSELGPLLGLASLPRHAYQASGTLEITRTDYGFSGLKLRAGEIVASADGRLGRPPEFNGTALKINASGPELSELGPVLSLPDLPALPFDISGGLRIGTGAIELEDIHGTLGTSRISVGGAFRPRGLPLHLALDLDVHGQEPADVTRFLQGLGLGEMPSLPSRPYTIAGHLEHSPDGFRLRQLKLSLGELKGSVDGLLGAPPGYHHTVLEIEGSGGNTANIGELVGKRPEIEGLRFHCKIRRLEQDLDDRGPVLSIEGNLAADRLQIEKGQEPEATPAPLPAGASAPPGNELNEEESPFVFSEKPFRLKLPTILRGRIDCNIGDLVLPMSHLIDTHVGIGLDHNGLHLDPMEATISGGGVISGSLSLMPRGDRLNVALRLKIDGTSPNLLFGKPPREDEPRLDARVELDGSGTSPHDLASTANGRFHVSLTEGSIESSILDSLGDSLFLSILDALNPFRKKESRTELECGVIAGVIEDGEVILDPLGLKTTKVTTVATGTIDLGTEELSINFASKARRGIGLSTSTLTNSYIKIGGILKKPSVELKPVTAAAKTGLAVFTAGISLLAEGLWNRVSSEADICTRMAEEVDELWREPRPAAHEAGQ